MVSVRSSLCLALLARLACPRAAAGATSLSPPLANLDQKPLLTDPSRGPPDLATPAQRRLCLLQGWGPASPISSDRFTGASELGSIFSLSTPQLKKGKPQHTLWPRRLGKVVEAVPCVDCFPIISFALPSQSFLQSLSREPVLLVSAADAPGAGERALGEEPRG